MMFFMFILILIVIFTGVLNLILNFRTTSILFLFFILFDQGSSF
jgi:hypothetical protein